MAMYDQSGMLIDADRRAREANHRADFWESVARRWCRAFDRLVEHLDDEDEETRKLINLCEQAKNEIPLVYDGAPS